MTQYMNMYTMENFPKGTDREIVCTVPCDMLESHLLKILRTGLTFFGCISYYFH